MKRIKEKQLGSHSKNSMRLIQVNITLPFPFFLNKNIVDRADLRIDLRYDLSSCPKRIKTGKNGTKKEGSKNMIEMTNIFKLIINKYD